MNIKQKIKQMKEDMEKISDPNIRHAKMKQFYLNQINDLNKQASDFYNKRKNNFPEYIISKVIWSSPIWNNAKHLHMEFNIFTYGCLTCQYCDKEIKDLHLRNFQIHHKNGNYNWDKLFAPEEVMLIHRECHKKVHNNFKKKNHNNKKIKDD